MSHRLVLLACIIVALSIVSVPAVLAEIIIVADQSCRANVLNPGTNNHDSSKLSIQE